MKNTVILWGIALTICMKASAQTTAPDNGAEATTAFDHDALDFERSERSPSGLIAFDMRIKDGNITFTVAAQTLGWVAAGISPEGQMAGADLVMAGSGPNGPYLYDTHGVSNSAPIVDQSQDVELLSATQNDTHTVVTFTRKLIVTDPDDLSIARGADVWFMYAYGYYDLIDGPHDVNYHFWNRGSFPTDLTTTSDENTLTDDEEDEADDFANGEQYLDEDRTFLLRWRNNATTIDIEMTAPTDGWVGFGFSPGKTMAGADIVMGGVASPDPFYYAGWGTYYDPGGPYIVDAFAWRIGAIDRDEEQNVMLVASLQNETHTSVTFRRTYVAYDPFDAPITDRVMNVIWAYGHRDVRFGWPRSGGYHGLANRGSTNITLILPGLREFAYPKSGTIVLDKDSEVILRWQANVENVQFQLGALTDGWLGLGITPYRGMKGADMAMLGVKDGIGYVLDVSAQMNGVPRVDKSQDVTLIASREIDGRTLVRFSRPLDAVEKRVDRDVKEGNVTLIWAFGKNDIDGKPRQRNYHGKNRGSEIVALIPFMEGEPNDRRF